MSEKRGEGRRLMEKKNWLSLRYLPSVNTSGRSGKMRSPLPLLATKKKSLLRTSIRVPPLSFYLFIASTPPSFFIYMLPAPFS